MELTSSAADRSSAGTPGSAEQPMNIEPVFSAAEVSMFYDGRLTVKMKLLGAAEFSEQVRDFAAILEQGIVQDNERGTLDMTLNTPHFIPRYGEN